MYVTMDVGKESPHYSSSPSSSSSPSQLSSPCTPTNPDSASDSSHAQAQAQADTQSSSQKRKAGRKKFRETRHPVYRGVRQRNRGKWVCEVREPNKKSRIWLGTYPTPEMAAMAHDVAVLALRGTSAVFNFPDSASLLPLARSSSAADIREAASKAAEAFRPNTTLSSFSLATSSSTENNNFCVQTNPCLVQGNKSQESVLEGDDIVNNTCTTQEKNRNDDEDESRSMFFDEEALYNMPGLLDSMAEGLLITPPSMKKALNWDEVDCETDLPLWTD